MDQEVSQLIFRIYSTRKAYGIHLASSNEIGACNCFCFNKLGKLNNGKTVLGDICIER